MEAYTNRVFHKIMVLAPATALCSAVFFTTMKLFGAYDDILIPHLILLDVTCLAYVALGIHMIRTGFGVDGAVKPAKFRAAKILIAVLTLVHWNMISYIVPSCDFWAYAPLFVLLSAFFYDNRLVLIESIGLFISIIISWVIRGEALTAPRDNLYFENMSLRVVALVLTLTAVYLMTVFVRSILVRELDNIADYDSLTRLRNRRKFGDQLTAFINRTRLTGRPFCAVMFDLDDFKLVNDTYGHACGDEVLKSFADVIFHGIKKVDRAYRWGGEEFLILYACEADMAAASTERILQEFAEECFTAEGDTFRVTASAGLAEYDPQFAPEEVINRADKKLYDAKHSGKACLMR